MPINPSYSSNHGQILLALRDLVQDLQPANLTTEEVKVRRNYLHNGTPFRGVTIYEIGEQTDEGTVGTQDIGYICGIVFCEKHDGDAKLASDQMVQWRELVRRRLKDQRLNVTIVNGTNPSEHVCVILRSGEDLNNKKYPNDNVKRITVAVWLREAN